MFLLITRKKLQPSRFCFLLTLADLYLDLIVMQHVLIYRCILSAWISDSHDVCLHFKYKNN